tara:strand:- start:2719 stop:3120 length:402 start_codon:yes stop_codon:yes gene_type:complete
MSLKNFKIFAFSLLILFSCTETNQGDSTSGFLNGDPCNIRIEISGKAPDVLFTLYNKSKDKAISIDKLVNVLDNQKDEFLISTYFGGKLHCTLKTKDSFGPKVKIKVFINDKFWQEAEGTYNPKIEGVIPFNF